MEVGRGDRVREKGDGERERERERVNGDRHKQKHGDTEIEPSETYKIERENMKSSVKK